MRSSVLLRNNRNYRNLWLAQVGSGFGDWFHQVALAQITLTMTHSAVSMGIVLLARSLPAVALGPFCGPFVDGARKKHLMMVSDCARSALAMGFIFAVLGHASWLLYVCSFLMGIAGVPFNPARRAVIPQVVPPDELSKANALESGSAGLLQIIGAACGGIVSMSLSPVFCFVMNAASYAWSAYHISCCHYVEEVTGNSNLTTYTASLQQGFRAAIVNPVARSIILIGISWGLAGGGYYILIPILGQETFHMGDIGIGLLYAIDGLGVLVGSMAVQQYIGAKLHRAVLWYGAAYLSQAVFFALMTQVRTLILGGLMLFFMRVSSGIIIPLDAYILQAGTDAKVRGRIFALHASTYGGVMQLSYVLSGISIEHLGVRLTGIIIGSMSLLCGLSWIIQFRTQRHSTVIIP